MEKKKLETVMFAPALRVRPRTDDEGKEVANKTEGEADQVEKPKEEMGPEMEEEVGREPTTKEDDEA